MEAIYKQAGEQIDYRPSNDVAAGQVVVESDLIGVTKLDIKAGELGALALSGVYLLTKAMGAGTAISLGEKVYWNSVNSQATLQTDNGLTGGDLVAFKQFGLCIQEANETDTNVLVKLG